MINKQVPVTDLDKKLHKTLMDVANDYANSVNPELNGTLYTGPDLETAKAEIKQAFIDNGWFTPADKDIVQLILNSHTQMKQRQQRRTSNV